MNEPKGGRVIAGKFRLEWPIGRGGMGTVWAAMHLQLDMPVAVKFMDPSAADADGRLRFEREARAIAQLRSPHVVQVLDHGVDNGMPYIVMELLEGEDLEGRLRRVKKLPIPVATRIFSQSARALRRAHDAGIVHRDLKPNNVFLARVDDEEVVKLLDFGVAKMAWTGSLDPHNESTQQGLLLGSPCYMSPEQARGNKNIDHRSDLWSLAVILFRSLTGIRPFDANTIADLIIKICAEPPPVASELMPDAPSGLDEFFFRAFSRDPEQRFQSALEMAADFEAIVRAGQPATETYAGGRILGGQRATTNPSMPAVGSPVRLATNPGIVITPQRALTNPGMPAVPSNVQPPPYEPHRSPSRPSMPAVQAALPMQSSPAMQAPPAMKSSPAMQAPPAMQAMPSAPPRPVYEQMHAQAPSDPYAAVQTSPAASSYMPAARTSYPDLPPAQPAMPSPGQEPSYASGAYSSFPSQDAYADTQSQDQSQEMYPAGEYVSDPGAPQDQDLSQDQEPQQGAFSDVSSPSMRLPDSAPHAASSTVREASPSGRQLIMWTTLAATVTAIMVVLIVIVARARYSPAPAAKPHSTAENRTPQSTTAAPQAVPQQPREPAPPPLDAVPSADPSALPGPAGGPLHQGSPAASTSASAAAVEAPVPFSMEEDAGVAPPPPTQTLGPRPPPIPTGKKRPNFGY